MTAGVLCSLSTDDPSLLGTNLEHEYETASASDPGDLYEAGVEGALRDAETRERLQRTGGARVEAEISGFYGAFAAGALR